MKFREGHTLHEISKQKKPQVLKKVWLLQPVQHLVCGKGWGQHWKLLPLSLSVPTLSQDGPGKCRFPLAWKNLCMTGVTSPALRVCEWLESFSRESNIKNRGLFLHWELSLLHWFYLTHETASYIIYGDIFDSWLSYFVLQSGNVLLITCPMSLFWH